ncbi:MAG TPA: FecR family protein, partial [Terriglobales bacterium]|nr:FecR family protein [Terriglobales bacterium]
MRFNFIAAKKGFPAAVVLAFLLVFCGIGSAQNPDLSQNPVPSPDVQNQQQPPDQDQMQDQGSMDDQDPDMMQDQETAPPANPPTLGPRPDQQSDEDKYGRPPMSEQPPKPSPNVGPYGGDRPYGNPNGGPDYGGPNAEPNSGDSDYSRETSENNGVGRVSLIHGDVSTQRGDSGDWSAAQLNAPLMTGDKVSTGDKARAEIQLDYANILRIAEHTQANIVNLTRKNVQIQLGHGMANYTVVGDSDADAEIDTPNVAIRTERRAASFRILVSADDQTEVLVRRGEVEITTPQGGTRVGENQFITIKGNGDQTQYRIGDAPSRDDWDQWNADRDHMLQGSVSRRHT